MPSVRSLVFKHYTYLVILILLLSVIIPLCSYYAKKGLIYIVIIAPFSYLLSSCSKCIKLNIYSFYNVKSVSNTKCIFLMHFISL